MIVKLKKDIKIYSVTKKKGRLLEVTRDFGLQLISEKKAEQVKSAFLKKGVYKDKNGNLTLDEPVKKEED